MKADEKPVCIVNGLKIIPNSSRQISTFGLLFLKLILIWLRKSNFRQYILCKNIKHGDTSAECELCHVIDDIRYLFIFVERYELDGSVFSNCGTGWESNSKYQKITSIWKRICSLVPSLNIYFWCYIYLFYIYSTFILHLQGDNVGGNNIDFYRYIVGLKYKIYIEHIICKKNNKLDTCDGYI